MAAFRLPRGAQLVRFHSADGLSLEGRLTAGDRDCGVVLCHPHPLYGGSMLTPVILTVEAAFHEAGFTTLAFNFRGVGGSEGAHGEGRAANDRRRRILVWESRWRPGGLGGPGCRLLPRRGAGRCPVRLRVPGRHP